MTLATDGSAFPPDGAGAAEAPPAEVRASTVAAEKVRRPEAKDLVRVMVVLSERVCPGSGVT
ncbi:hypothetical protein GCM10007170_03600 [Arthrobacter liuii]|uniref:Uncharacterized protein n=1 Tax=Arthrobacter liuii TaxID=1476996 RepID=A0ABQ2AHT7_9MICC|nr:hypothetical protein GCM10007170_03600 [Arthrobacter liuii]